MNKNTIRLFLFILFQENLIKVYEEAITFSFVFLSSHNIYT